MESKYPEPWDRQTPKGYDPLAMAKEVCNCNCNCQTTQDEIFESQVDFE